MRVPMPRPPDCDAALVLADGSVFWGRGLGAVGTAIGELCFNTAVTGYQEILTDPSSPGQIIAFTFPHIGNVGTNPEDLETITPAVRGLVLRAAITDPANYRATASLDSWLRSHGLVGISGVDTRRLTRKIRDLGPPHGIISYDPEGTFDLGSLRERALAWPGLEGTDLALEVTCRQTYEWTETVWARGVGYGRQENPRYHVVAVDYGAKRNILRMLATHGCRVTVVPATAATGAYAVPVLRDLLGAGKPIFGICLGHQLLAIALGGRTFKMSRGHRGANHPVQDLRTGKVEITSQNHGFIVDSESLPPCVAPTHLSLFDQTNEGLRVLDKPIFSVQYHPEASPGPQDSHYLFEHFVALMGRNA